VARDNRKLLQKFRDSALSRGAGDSYQATLVTEMVALQITRQNQLASEVHLRFLTNFLNGGGSLQIGLIACTEMGKNQIWNLCRLGKVRYSGGTTVPITLPNVLIAD
jgi:hypothetical protein